MKILVDTNVLVRAGDVAHRQHDAAVKCVPSLISRGDTLCIVPQVIYEFWVVCTRPVGENGLGLSVDDAVARLDKIKQSFEVLVETPDFHGTWEELVKRYDVKGKSAHDARLVAAMQIHGVTTLLTFNKQHFARYPMIRVQAPDEVIGSSPQTD